MVRKAIEMGKENYEESECRMNDRGGQVVSDIDLGYSVDV
jgi:hypothetical protein